MSRNRFSKEKPYVNVIMSDNKEAMQSFRNFLAKHHITNVANDSYTLDWSTNVTPWGNGEDTIIVQTTNTKYAMIKL